MGVIWGQAGILEAGFHRAGTLTTQRPWLQTLTQANHCCIKKSNSYILFLLFFLIGIGGHGNKDYGVSSNRSSSMPFEIELASMVKRQGLDELRAANMGEGEPFS